MAVVKCEKGHYYDDEKYEQCPHCLGGLKHIKKETHVDDFNELMTISEPVLKEPAAHQEHITVNLEAFSESNDDGKTIGIYSFTNGTKPLAGWLVCTKGPAKGRDYRIFYGWNKIGRDLSMEIYVPEDRKISKENHLSIVFDEKSGGFYLVNEQGALSYLNGENILNSTGVKTGDVITMGDSDFVFIAFCTEERKW